MTRNEADWAGNEAWPGVAWLGRDEHWHKKLCALFEWIAVLETETSKPNNSGQPRLAQEKP
jgi:hypothetical protein